MEIITALRDIFEVAEYAKLPFSCLFMMIFIGSMYAFGLSKEKRRKLPHSSRRFAITLIMAIVTVVLNIAASLFFVHPANWENPWCIWLTKLQNSSVIIFGLFASFYLCELKIQRWPKKFTAFQKKILAVQQIVWIAIFIVLAVLALVMPITFKASETGVGYFSGPSAYICLSSIVLQLVFFIYLFVTTKRTKDNARERGVLFGFALILTMCLICYVMVPYINSLSVVIMFCIVAIYIPLENNDKVLKEQYLEEKQRADLASKVKSSFLASMSHEIRTPINAIIGMNDLILRETRDEKVAEYANDIHDASNILLSLINDVLDYSKLESGKVEITPIEYDLRNILQEEHLLFQIKAKAKSLSLEFNIDPSIPRKLYGDDIKLKQVMTNLLNNAVKYTSSGSVTLSIELLGINDNVARLLFKVSDTGVGIKPEHIERLYQAFERITNDRSIEGSGLGLSIVVHLLNHMNSSIHVNSVFGEGSEFWFELDQPVIDPTPIDDFHEFVKQHGVHFDDTGLSSDNAHILCVDDNAMNLKVFVNLLKDSGLRIDTAESGKRCLELCREKKYDLVFMDHMMPDMDGIETFYAMKDDPYCLCKNVPVVMLTANAVAGMKEMFLQYGFSAFIAKPVNVKTLMNTIADLLPEKVSLIEYHTDSDDNMELPIVDGMDAAFAKIHFERTEQIYEAAQLFVEMSQSDINELNSYYAETMDDEMMLSYRVKVHSMKNSAAIIGLVPLAGMAKTLEDAARNGKISIIHSMHEIFIEKWMEITERLHVFETNKEEKLPASDHIENVIALLKSMKAAADEIELDKMDDIMKHLKKYSYEGALSEQIEKINSAVQRFDSDEVSELLADYAE